MRNPLHAKLSGARRRQSGFNLMELMVALAVAGMLLGLAVPNFREFVRNSRLTSASNDLLASIQLARNEAVKRQQPVAVCATSDPNASPPVCSGGAFTAWVVWVDADNDWVIDNVAAEPVLSRQQALHDTLTVRSDNNGRVKYQPIGFLSPASGGITPSTRVVICDERGTDVSIGASAARAIEIAPTGRARVTRVHEDVEDALAVINANCP